MPAAVQLGGDRDHAVGDVRQKQVRQRERPEVVGRRLRLEAVSGIGQGNLHDSRVIDENVDITRPLPGEPADRLQARHVKLPHLGAAGHGPGGPFASAHGTDGEDDTGPGPGDLTGGDQAEPAGCAGDHGRASCQVGQIGCSPFRHG